LVLEVHHQRQDQTQSSALLLLLVAATVVITMVEMEVTGVLVAAVLVVFLA